jgi:hypothetical protein
MRLTKYGHSGLLVEEGPARLLLDRNPGARVLCDQGSAEQLAAAGAAVEVVHDREELDVGGVAVRVSGRDHAVIHPTSRWSPTPATW